MHTETLSPWTHSHDFEHQRGNEVRTWIVVGITGTVMVVELVAGYLTRSMALVADGWHMGSHFGALALAGVAYWYARQQLANPRYTFGAGKIYALAGYTNAILLAVVALAVAGQSIERILNPVEIDFLTALPVAVGGLVVNLVSAVILHRGSGHMHDHHGHGHHHDHDHDHDHDHARPHDHDHDHDHAHDPADHAHDPADHVDHNLRAAYMHVLADAVTSVAAIVALLGGYFLGARALDPIMGIVGAALIIRWSWGLSRSASRQLLDVVPSDEAVARIREHLETIDDTRVTDLHLWEMAPGRRGCIVSLVAAEPRDVDTYREAVAEAALVHHLTVEVFRRPEPPTRNADA